MKIEDLEFYIEQNIKLNKNLECCVFFNTSTFIELFYRDAEYSKWPEEFKLNEKIIVYRSDNLTLGDGEVRIIITYNDNMIKNIKIKLLSKSEQIIKNIIE